MQESSDFQRKNQDNSPFSAKKQSPDEETLFFKTARQCFLPGSSAEITWNWHPEELR